MSKSYFIDAHCHLSDERVFAFAEDWIKEALKQNIQKMMMGGVEPSEWDRQAKLRTLFPNSLKTSFGIHPWWVEKYSRSELEHFLELQKESAKTADAIGEAGLDHHAKRDPNRFQDQEFVFRAQIKTALALQKPLVLHVVTAHAKALEIVKEMKANQVPILVHSFSGSPEIAHEWVKEGALLSFSGNILWDGRYEKAKQALVAIPLENILFETDSPDQAWRKDGENQPKMVQEVYRGAAQLLSIDLEQLQEKVAENFARLG